MNTNTVHLYGGTAAFEGFIKAIEPALEVRRFDSAHDAVRAGACRALILLPDYENGCESIRRLPITDIELLAERKAEGGRMYVENYISYNFYQASVFGCEALGAVNHVYNETLYACGELARRMPGERILQASGAAYLPVALKLLDDRAPNREVLLKLGRYIGTSMPAREASDASCVMLRTGSVWTSVISMSAFDRINMLPNSRWREVFARVFSGVLDVSYEAVLAAFTQTWPKLNTRMPSNARVTDDIRQAARERAVRAALEWHLDSGMILGDMGEGGSVEMIMSGNQDVYQNRRVDAGLYTGWLFYAAGKYLKDAKYERIGENVFRYFVDRAQVDRGVRKGLYSWYHNENAGPRTVFSIDSGRCGIALCNFYELCNDKRLLNNIRALADAFLGWLNGDLLYSNSDQFDCMYKDKPYEAESGLGTPRTAAIYAEMITFLVMAGKHTGNAEYINRAASTADRLASMYPNYEYYGHTTSSRNARLLMLLSAVQTTGARDYTPMINHLINYLASIQLPCGAIYSEDNLSFAEFGEHDNKIGENGISTPWDKDLISDQLYCVNNALAALSIARGLTGGVDAHKAGEVFNQLLDYTVKIQITEDDPRLRGGWMRAYDTTLDEYFGLNLDMFWGPYCIMAGWTMGIIPLALLYELMGECPYICK